MNSPETGIPRGEVVDRLGEHDPVPFAMTGPLFAIAFSEPFRRRPLS